MTKVMNDYGHGGTDPGALGNGLREKDLTLAIGKKVDAILKKHGLVIVNSRTTDTTVSLTTRSTKANKENVKIFISIHINAFKDPKANGVETFSYPGSKEGAKLAKAIQDELVKAKLFKTNRGVKTANFHVLRETKAPAALTELGFITNVDDAQVLRTKQDDIAKAVATGVLNYLGIKSTEKPTTGTPIIGPSKTTIEQMKEWAKNKGANKLFIDLAPIFYDLSVKAGIDPSAVYTQSAKETGYFKFGGVLDASFKNPCGLKVSAGGGDKDPNAHKRFKSWEEGVQAQIDHLALYAGVNGYPKAGTPDPRHFPYLKGTATTVESLGGKWAPSSTYGTDIVKMIKELESTKVGTTPAPAPKPTIKTVAQVAQEVIFGKWGNGTTRKTNLEKAGYNYTAVQNEVNKLVNTKPSTKTPIQVAREVIAGKWGNGATRKSNLEKAGYNYTTIQNEVNRLLK